MFVTHGPFGYSAFVGSSAAVSSDAIVVSLPSAIGTWLWSCAHAWPVIDGNSVAPQRMRVPYVASACVIAATPAAHFEVVVPARSFCIEHERSITRPRFGAT